MTADASLFIALICSWLVLVLVVLLPGLQVDRPTGLWKLGEKIMSVIDEAITRFTKFTQGVLDQLRGAKEANDAQTAKLAELQAKLDAALSDDAADKAAITALQDEVNTLQEEVAAKINAAVDTLEGPVAEVPVAPVVDPVPAADPAPVVDAPVEGVLTTPVVEDVTPPQE